MSALTRPSPKPLAAIHIDHCTGNHNDVLPTEYVFHERKVLFIEAIPTWNR
jgi:hypothetical protein